MQESDSTYLSKVRWPMFGAQRELAQYRKMALVIDAQKMLLWGPKGARPVRKIAMLIV
jgi:hypothetical protein